MVSLDRIDFRTYGPGPFGCESLCQLLADAAFFPASISKSVPQPTVTSQLFPHPDQKPLPQEPYEQMVAGMQDFEITENDLEGVQHDDEGNPEYTPR